jgi:hypothetical protein
MPKILGLTIPSIAPTAGGSGGRVIDLERMRLELERAAPPAQAVPAAWRQASEPDQKIAARAATIKARLAGAGISQEMLAQAAVVSRSAICHALSGRGPANRIMAYALELLGQVGVPKKRGKHRAWET